jgi:uncharacterized membrane protein YqjE
MVDQATMRNGHNTSAPAREMTRNVGGLASDIASLVELQARLFALDAKASLRRMIAPVVLAVLGVALLLGAVPVLWMAVAYWLFSLGMNGAAALFLSFVIGAVLGVVGVVIAWFLFRGSLSSFQRSREELANNIAWIKDALKPQSRTARETPPS